MKTELLSYNPEHEDRRDEISDRLGEAGIKGYSQELEDQIMNEIWYSDAIKIDPLENGAKTSKDEILWRMELDHTVEAAPNFLSQLEDETRTNLINSKEHDPIQMSEHDALMELQGYLEKIQTLEDDEDRITPALREHASDMVENLTFIGDKEYKKATKGIADYWKSLLDKDNGQQIYIATGRISSDDAGEVEGQTPPVKSDKYLLDSILEHFNDDELEKYSGKMITSEDKITATNADDLKVVFLDDWIASGQQLVSAAESFMSDYPEFADSVEVQVIAANERRVKSGLTGMKFGMDGNSLRDSLPVRSYYLAHSTRVARNSGARITGAHSAVDYDFCDNIDAMDIFMYRNDIENDGVPLLADISQPYRQAGIDLKNEKRLQSI